MASVEHATVEEGHIEAAIPLYPEATWGSLPADEDARVLEIAQALADWERKGEERGWADAKAAVKGMQPSPPRTETAFECFSANSKRILDVLREMDYYRHPESRPR